MLQYRTSSGKKDLEITQHALNRFQQRFWTAFNYAQKPFLLRHPYITAENLHRITNGDALLVLEEIFAKAGKVKLKNFTKEQKKRHQKHGHSTIRYRYKPFDFVITDGKLVTVEIVGPEELNHY
jgi:hypothetical protein